MRVSLVLQRDPGPAVHLGVWQDPVNSFIMLFKDELPPLFFEIFAYIHFLTFLSVFPPFPHTHTEIASLLQSGRLQALRVGLEACGLFLELASGRGG